MVIRLIKDLENKIDRISEGKIRLERDVTALKEQLSREIAENKDINREIEKLRKLREGDRNR